MGSSKPDPNEMFDHVVKNALDFIQRALSSLEKDPRLSVIFFWAGLELLLKARLLHEHWSLILTKPEDADVNKFQIGDFQSVTFDKAVKRLRSVCGLVLKGAGNDCFKNLKDHRNRLMHFVHEGYSDSPDSSILEQVALEQCTAWYYLHKWLTVEWKAEFGVYHEEIEKTQNMVKENTKYLSAKFDDIKPKLKEITSSGIQLSGCYACLFKAATNHIEATKNTLSVLRQRCYVCETSTWSTRIPCPTCSKSIEIEDLGEGTCESCGHKVDMVYLLSVYGESQSPKDETMEPSNAYCSDCEYSDERSVIPLDDGGYFCLCCHGIHECLHRCEFCGERVTSNTGDSYLFGCVMCDGRGMSD